MAKRAMGVRCPACGASLVVAGRFVLDSTDGPIEHVEGACHQGHRFACAVDYLSPSGPALPPGGRHEPAGHAVAAGTIGATTLPGLRIVAGGAPLAVRPSPALAVSRVRSVHRSAERQ